LPAAGFPLGKSRNRKDQQQSKKPGQRFHVGPYCLSRELRGAYSPPDAKGGASLP
jgi:hypothetical protein